ncbi:thialysine N-epsilon-acetyltransferase-like [Cydia fagiglandana]|uniref:thialysine N-epsilon-acetyltransferase-like n=1 Tax=Cydia fagiglandana TaxID=1458189 RepID=UPI002FEE4443
MADHADSTEPETVEITIRLARPEDMKIVHEMIQELAVYEGVPDGPKLTVEDLVEDGFNSEHPWFFVLLAEKGNVVLGSALCNRAYSSWSRRAFYIEDLFVRPAARRQGIGLMLMRELSRRAVMEGVNRIDWHVLKSNTTALAFYNRLGARDLRVTEGRTALRLDRDCIEALASGS